MEINGSRNKPLSFDSRFFASIAGSKHVKPPSPVDTLAKEALLALTGDADGLLREEHARLMDSSPGYSFYFLSYLDRHRRLLAAKPVLIQECVAEDPWRVLVAVMLLNKTAGRHAIPVFWSIMERWPSAEAMAGADVAELVECIRPLGLQDRRAQRLTALSVAYVKQPPEHARPRPSKYYSASRNGQHAASQPHGSQKLMSPISHLPGSGPYAMDSYRIFCCGPDEWRSVLPADKELRRYLEWRWAIDGKKWSPHHGVAGPTDDSYIESLIANLNSSEQ